MSSKTAVRSNSRSLRGCSMDFPPSDLKGTSTVVARAGARPAKIVISGGFAAGKTTFVGSISEIEPLTTEAIMTSVSRGVDDFGRAGLKTTTTVGIGAGRLPVAPDLVLFLFGTPGQGRFFFAWDELTRGAVGAVIVVDTRR